MSGMWRIEMSAANDPLGWRGTSAPSLAEFEVLAIEAFRRLPENFRALCADLVIKIDDFATDEVLDHLGARSEFDVLGPVIEDRPAVEPDDVGHLHRRAR